MKNKTWKFILGFAVVLVLSIAFFLILDGRGDDGYYEEQMRVAREMEREYKEKYKNDTYGGDTPEETLELFIEALKAGDTDLASKYFVPEKQEEMKNDLRVGKENENIRGLQNLLEELIKNGRGERLSEDSYKLFQYVGGNNLPWVVVLVMNLETKVWKIESL